MKSSMAELRIHDPRRSKFEQLFVNFLVGIFIGSVITHVTVKYFGQDSRADAYLLSKVVLKSKYSVTPVNNFIGNSGHHAENEELQHGDIVLLGEDILSNWMWSRIRILCWIMTSPESLQEKAAHVKATWARRCNIILFMSSENTDFPTIAVSEHEGRDYLWEKTSGAFDYIYKNYLDKADWFLKADDDTYVIVENLRKLVSLYDPEKAIYFGRKLKFPHKEEVVYMQGGAGYVLSRKAVKVLVEESFQSSFYARIKKWLPGEDVMVSMLLQKAGVEEGYSRNEMKETFHAVPPNETFVPAPHWLTHHNFFPVKQGPECCSNYSISFHYVTPDTMHWIEYMVYHLRPFGVGYHMCPSNTRNMIGLSHDWSVTLSSSVNATETLNVTNEENKDQKKSEDKPKPKKKRAPRGREKVKTNVNTEELPEKKSEEKSKSEKKRTPRRRERRVKNGTDVKEQEE